MALLLAARGRAEDGVGKRIRPERAGARRPPMKDTAFWHAVACVCSDKTDIWSMLEMFFNCKQDVPDSDGEADNEGNEHGESNPGHPTRGRKPVRVQTPRSKEECMGWEFASSKISSVLYQWPLDLDGVDIFVACALYVEHVWSEVEWDLQDDAAHAACIGAEVQKRVVAARRS
eukprot:524070-Rhodomonas_salina.1